MTPRPRPGRALALGLSVLAAGLVPAEAAAGSPRVRAGFGAGWTFTLGDKLSSTYGAGGGAGASGRVSWVFSPFGELSLRLGFHARKGSAFDPGEVGDPAEIEALEGQVSRLAVFPVQVGADLRLDRGAEQAVVPHLGGGIALVGFHEDAPAGNGAGAAPGVYATVGAGIRLIGREAAWMDRPVRGRTPVDVQLDVEATALYARRGEGAGSLDLSSVGVTAALTFAVLDARDPSRLVSRTGPVPEAAPVAARLPPQVTGVVGEAEGARFQLDLEGEWGIVPGALLRVYREVTVATADGRSAPPVLQDVGWVEVDRTAGTVATARLRAVEPGQRVQIGDRVLATGGIAAREAPAEVRFPADFLLAADGETPTDAGARAVGEWASRLRRVEGSVTVAVRLPAAGGMAEAYYGRPVDRLDYRRPPAEGETPGDSAVRLVEVTRERDAATAALDGARAVARLLASALGVPEERVIPVVQPPDPAALPGGEVIVRAEGVTLNDAAASPVPAHRPAPKKKTAPRKKDPEPKPPEEWVTPLS